MRSHINCNHYNYAVIHGDFEECGTMDPFHEWKKVIKEDNFGEFVYLLMDQYDYPELTPGPGKAGSESLNMYYAAKYGMFTCIDNYHRRRTIPFDPTFILYWERNAYRRKRCYYGGLAYAVLNGGMEFEDLEPWRRHYR